LFYPCSDRLKAVHFFLDTIKASGLYTCKTHITCINNKQSHWMR
jgi:hypothetical protein